MARTNIVGFSSLSLGFSTMGIDGQATGGVSFSITTVIHRPFGTASLSLGTGSGAAGSWAPPVSGQPQRIRFAVRIINLPTTTGRTICGVVGTNQRIRLNPNGTLTILNFANVVLGTTTTALTDTTKWHLVSGKAYSTLAVGDPLLQIDGVDDCLSVVSGSYSPAGPQLGPSNDTVADSYAAYFADYVTDDADGEFLTDSKIGLALPISDNARATLWQNGAAGTTNLWDAVNNTPPVGKLTASKTATTQIQHAGAGTATDDYDANLTTYTDLGVGTIVPSLGEPTTVGSYVAIGGHASDIYRGTSFQAFANGSVLSVAAKIGRTSALVTDSLAFELWSDTNGTNKPLAKLVDLGTVAATSLPINSFTRVGFAPSTPTTLVNGTTYWVVARRTGAAALNDYFIWEIDTTQRGTNTDAFGDSTPTWTIVTGHSNAINVFIGAGDLVIATQPIIVHGEDIATGTKLLNFRLKSNPSSELQSANFSAGADAGACGTYSTNWTILRGAIIPYPTGTLGTSPVMSVRRPETASRLADVCFMGMYVEWVTYAAAGVADSIPNVRAWQAINRAATY